MAETASAERTDLTRRLGVFFAAVYFVQGIGEPGAGIAAQPIFFLTASVLAGVGGGWLSQHSFLSALATAACWLIIPLVRIDGREQARG
jgi:hypothetical protein